MKAILYLCQKSLEIRSKKQKSIEEAVVDRDCEKGVIYDEDEDADGEIILDEDEESDEDEWNMDSDDEDSNDLYESKLDKVDDVLFVQEQINSLQQANPQHFQNVIALLNTEEQNGLQMFFSQAQ
jgi:hypothetical protein